MKLQHSLFFWLIVISVSTVSGCGTTLEKSAMKTIAGEILFDDTEKLPENTQVTISLEDASAFDAASGVMVVKEFSPSGPPPYRFTLEYNSNWINPDGDYAIRARVDVDGKFMFSGIEKINGEKKGNVLQVQVERVDYSD